MGKQYDELRVQEFVPESTPTPDEIEAIRESRESAARGELYRLDEIDWDDPELLGFQ